MPTFNRVEKKDDLEKHRQSPCDRAHFCALVRSSSGLTHLLDEASESGWQMVGFGVDESGNLACFKRPRASAPRAAASR